MEMFSSWSNLNDKATDLKNEKPVFIGLHVIQKPFLMNNGFLVYELKKCCKKYKKSKACKKCPRN